nr:hypothetical protein [Tanacetum cinerariifolium]
MDLFGNRFQSRIVKEHRTMLEVLVSNHTELCQEHTHDLDISVGNKMHKAFPLLDNATTRKDDEQSGRTVTITTKDMQRKKNDVQARTTLLLSLPDEHQLRFSKFKTTKELWAAIL